MISFVCHCCRTLLIVPDSRIGQVVHCPLSGVPIRLSGSVPRFSEQRWLGKGKLVELLAFVRLECCSDKRKQGQLLCGMGELALNHLPMDICWRALELGQRLREGHVREWQQSRLRSQLEAELRHLAHGHDPALAIWAHLLHQCVSEPPTYCRPLLYEAAPPGDDAARRLLYDLFGNPFRPVKVERAWLTRSDGLVAKMAQVLRTEGRFEDLPILADALEDAGCTDPDLLAHCRSSGPHFRGCWALDRLQLASP